MKASILESYCFTFSREEVVALEAVLGCLIPGDLIAKGISNKQMAFQKELFNTLADILEGKKKEVANETV